MRVKSDAKKQSILDAAYELFRLHGFEKTSMTEINLKAGCSKPTLYSYFSSKEELFVECMVDLAEHFMEGCFSGLQNSEREILEQLRMLGENIVRMHCSPGPDVIGVQRLMVAEAGHSGIGKMFLAHINARQAEVAAFLENAMATGKLRRADPMLATRQFRALLEAEFFEPLILAAMEEEMNDEYVRRVVDNALDAFLRIYAPETGQTEKA